MILEVVKCDICGTIIDEHPDGGAMDGFTEPALKRHGKDWPNNLYHMCQYCVFRARVAFVRRKEGTP